MLRRSRARNGLTLLELVIGVIVLSILAAIAVPNFSRALERAKVQDAQETLVSLYEAQRLYRLDNDTYGELLNDLVNNGYATDPDPGNANPDWNFASSDIEADTFVVTATRTGGPNSGATLEVDENFKDQTFGGSHPLRDQ